MLSKDLLPMGNISKVGTPVNGRQDYVLTNEEMKKKFTFSVPEDKADSFEKLYAENNAILDMLDDPKYKEEQVQQGVNLQNKLKKNTLIGGTVGLIIPAAIAIISKGSKVKRSILGVLGSLIGGAIGAVGTAYIGSKKAVVKALESSPAYQKMVEVSQKAKDMGVEMKYENIA